MEMKRRFWSSRPVIATEVENRTRARVGPRRRVRVILTSAMAALLGGFLISYAFPPKYTSQSLLLVRKQTVTEDIVPSLITDDFGRHLATIQQQVLAGSRLRPIVEHLGITNAEEQSALIQEIRVDTSVEVDPDLSQNDVSAAQKEPVLSNFPGITVSYSNSNPRRAQQICNELTGLLMEENLRDREGRIEETTDFLKRQVSDAKANLSTLGAQLLASGKDRAPRSPEAEATYKVLALDYDIDLKGYEDLRSKLARAELAAQLEAQQMGEQWRVLNPASLPEDPAFPNRWLFALGGLVAGLLLGIGRTLRATKPKTEPRTPILHPDAPVIP